MWEGADIKKCPLADLGHQFFYTVFELQTDRYNFLRPQNP